MAVSSAIWEVMLVTDSLGNSACAESTHQHKFKHQTCCPDYQRRSNTLDAWNQRRSIHPHRYLQRACFSEGTQKVEKLFQNTVLHYSNMFCQTTSNIDVFGWFALEAGSKGEQNDKTLIFTIHFKPLLDTRSQKNCVLRICWKSMWIAFLCGPCSFFILQKHPI